MIDLTIRGCVLCETCDGSGEIKVYYEYDNCGHCNGRGFLFNDDIIHDRLLVPDKDGNLKQHCCAPSAKEAERSLFRSLREMEKLKKSREQATHIIETFSKE